MTEPKDKYAENVPADDAPPPGDEPTDAELKEGADDPAETEED